MNKIWFKRKTYGWGWTPSTWQGWLVLFVWLVIFLFLEARMDDSNVLVNLVIIFILTSFLIFICYKKGEKPKWQWGVEKEGVLDDKKMIEKYLQPYSNNWSEKYNKEAILIKKNLGDFIINIEHIGSTAIPGLSAKPIIDIAVLVKSISDINIFTESLEKIGYNYKPEMSSVERIFLRKGDPVEYHLSISEPKYTFWTRQLLFRNYLRKHPEYREEYKKIKENCIKNLNTNELEDISKSKEYSTQKGPFIQEILQLAEFESNK